VVAGQGADLETARTVAVNTLVAMEVFYLFSVRYLKAPSFTLVGLQGTPRVLAAVAGVLVLQALFTYAPFMQTLFNTRPLDWTELLACTLAGVAVLLVLEVEKAVLRGTGPRQSWAQSLLDRSIQHGDDAGCRQCGAVLVSRGCSGPGQQGRSSASLPARGFLLGSGVLRG
jgi:uncharacterized protein (DUF486 family)